MRRVLLIALALAAILATTGCILRPENSQSTSRLHEPSMTSPIFLNRHDTESAAYIRYDPF